MVGMRVAGTRWGAALLVFAALLAACSDDEAGPSASEPRTTLEATTSTTTTTSPPLTATTTTTAAPTTTTADPLARPEKLVSNPNRNSVDEFDTGGDNPYLVAMELRDLFVYLEGNPTNDASTMVDLLFEPGYPYWDRILVGFLELTDNPGWRYTDPGVETLAIDVVAADNSTTVVRIADQRAEQVIADEFGEVVKIYDGWERRVTEFTLRRGDDELWRYADAAPSQPISADEVAGMVAVEWVGRSA